VSRLPGLAMVSSLNQASPCRSNRSRAQCPPVEVPPPENHSGAPPIQRFGIPPSGRFPKSHRGIFTVPAKASNANPVFTALLLCGWSTTATLDTNALGRLFPEVKQLDSNALLVCRDGQTCAGWAERSAGMALKLVMVDRPAGRFCPPGKDRPTSTGCRSAEA
jgi:hypothetical protein